MYIIQICQMHYTFSRTLRVLINSPLQVKRQTRVKNGIPIQDFYSMVSGTYISRMTPNALFIVTVVFFKCPNRGISLSRLSYSNLPIPTMGLPVPQEVTSTWGMASYIQVPSGFQSPLISP